METFAHILIGWSLALAIFITILTSGISKEKKRAKDEKKRLLNIISEGREGNNIIVKRMNTNMLEYQEEIEKIRKEKDILIQRNVDKLGEYSRNMQNKTITFESEIDSLEETIQELKSRLHNEQIDSNNKGRARDKWRKKFETLENTVEEQGFGKEIMQKYKKNWKTITLAYNNAKKGTKQN